MAGFDRLIRSQNLWLTLTIILGTLSLGAVVMPIINTPKSAPTLVTAARREVTPTIGVVVTTKVITPTIFPTDTAIPTRTPFPTARPTDTPVPTRTPFPTARPTETQIPTRTPFPTALPTDTPVPTIVPTLAPTVAASATAVRVTVAPTVKVVVVSTTAAVARPTQTTEIHQWTKTKYEKLMFVPEPGECWVFFSAIPSWLNPGVGGTLSPCTNIYLEPGVEYMEPGMSYMTPGESTLYRVVSRDNRLKFSGVTSEINGTTYLQVVPLGTETGVFWVKKGD